MFKTILVLFFVALAVNGQTLCDKYAAALKLNGSALVGSVVDGTINAAVSPSSGIAQFFNGANGGTNFTGNPGALAGLRAGLIAFFGSAGALNCTDNTTGNYVGGPLGPIHTPLNTTFKDYFIFNNALLGVMSGAGVVPADIMAVATLLDTLRSGVCIFSDCTSICNKVIVPGVTNSSAVMGSIVDNAVAAAVGSPILLPYFNGSIGSGHGDFTSGAALANLKLHLVQFFGGQLGCTDGTIGAYAGQSLVAAHAGMKINTLAFNTFNAALMGVIAAAGITPSNPDYTTIYGVLNSTKSAVCTDPDCNPVGTSTGGQTTGGQTTGGQTTGGQTTGGQTTGGGTTGGKTTSTGGGTTGGTTGGQTTPTPAPATPTPAPSTTGFGMVLVAPILSLLSVFLF